MPYVQEVFTTWDPGETDPATYLSQTASRSSFTDLDRDIDAWHCDDKGVDHFAGDFEHLVDVVISASVAGSFVDVWALVNVLDDTYGIYLADGDYLLVTCNPQNNSKVRFAIGECDGGDLAYAVDSERDLGTYYLRIKRVEADGDYGTLYCDIYSSDADRTNEANALANLSQVLHTSKKDFRYIYCPSTDNVPLSNLTQTGYCENLNLQEVQLISPSSIASAEAFGTLKVNHIIKPTGIASAEAFGTATVTQVQIISPTGIASAEAFGTPQVNLIITSVGAIASSEAFGTATLQLYLKPTGIASAEAFGTPTTVMIVEPVAIASSEAFGTLTLEIYIKPTGITSSEAFGTLTTVMIVEPSAITSSEAIGTCHVRVEVNPQNHDGSVGWTDESKAYDEDTGTFAYDDIPAGTSSDWLTVNRELALTCSRARVWYSRQDGDIGEPTLEIHRDGAWVEV